MKAMIGVLSTSLLLVSLSTGCMHSHSEEFVGASYAALKEQQIANPDAGQEAQPVEGIASTTADQVNANYHERQQASSQGGQTTSKLRQISQD